jgi:hypothetical protein
VKNRNTKDITTDKTGEIGQQENNITKPEENVRRRRKEEEKEGEEEDNKIRGKSRIIV